MTEQPDLTTREVEEDHDLLTFNEAGARLHEEIARLEQQAREAADPDVAAVLRRRVEMLNEAASRNDRSAAAQPGATGFLDYRPRQST
jgi:hypothetical protein